MASTDEDMNTSKDLLFVNPEKEYAAFNILSNQTWTTQSVDPPKITRIQGSSVLDQVKSFLPQIEEANSSLQREISKRPEVNFDIENVEEDDKYIEMNIAIFDRTNCGDSNSSSESDGSSASDSSDVEDSTEIDRQTRNYSNQEINEHNFEIRRREKRKEQKPEKPVIEELKNGANSSETIDDQLPTEDLTVSQLDKTEGKFKQGLRQKSKRIAKEKT